MLKMGGVMLNFVNKTIWIWKVSTKEIANVIIN